MHRRWLWPAALVAALTLAAAGCGGDDADDAAPGEEPAGAEQVITVNWGTEPPSLDPGLATDTTSANILLNIMDPLVKLDENIEPVPNAAESWDVDGATVTLHLRDDLAWTNGDPVTAEDFEWSWKRTMSPELGADYAYQLYGIQGAQEYNECNPDEADCEALREQVGVEALDDSTLQVTLTSPQPWFIGQLSHHSFLAVHRPTVEQFAEQWTEARNMVSNGPFRLARWEHDSRIDLEKWEEWRNADEVALTRVNGRMISEGTTAVQAFEAGEIDAQIGGLPPQDISRLKGMETYQQYPALGTYYYGFNVSNLDVNQRRAMALAIDRRSLIDNVAQADQLPATGYTPDGMPGFENINPASPYLAEEGDMERAQELMEQVENPKTTINLFHNDAPGHREIAVAVQAMWRELGLDVQIRSQEWAQYLEFLGPPPSDQVDAYRLGWIGDYPDAMNFLEMWTCNSGNNNTGFCNEEYDRLVNEARATEDDDARYDIYAELEQIMFGEDGEVPLAPIYWYTFTSLERESIKDTFNIGPQNDIDLTQVRVEG